jgi:hypothetical protein
VKFVEVIWTAYQNVRLDIGKGKLCTVKEGLLLAVDPIILTNILFQTPSSQCLLLFGEPARGTGKIGQDKDGDYGHDDSDRAFDDEQPTPGKVRRNTENMSDIGSYQARRPSLLSIPLVMPAAMRPEKAPERREPEYKAAVRKPSSLRVYHALRKYRQPGYPRISHGTSSHRAREKRTK